MRLQCETICGISCKSPPLLIYLCLQKNDNELIFCSCDLLITKQDNQRFLNLILISVFVPFIVYLIFLSKTDKNKFVWISFLSVDSSLHLYARKNSLSQGSAKVLRFLYETFIYVCRGAYTFYLLVVYWYYVQSLKLSMDRNIGTTMFVLAFFPTAVTSVLSISVFYVMVVKIITIFVLFNFFQALKLDKLSKDLVHYIDHHQENDRKFIARHLRELHFFLENFRHSQVFFNFSNQIFLLALFMTLVWYPYTVLINSDLSVNFLIISYSLNVSFVLLPLFCSASIFRYKVRFYLLVR